jgi:phosphate transport system substrate-binding protein
MKTIYILAIVVLLFSACNSTDTDKLAADTPTSGTIYISVDESFQPVIQEQIKVFQSSFPNAKIIAEYKSEAECLKDLQKDSTRMVIVSRGLNDNELAYYESKLQYKPRFAAVAYDAVALVLPNNATDSLFRLSDIKAMLNGSSKKTTQLVVDGNSATSTVRYLIDSILKGDTLASNVNAAKGSKAVLDYVASNGNSIGFVGISWIGNPQDPEQLAYLKKLKLGLVECRFCGNDMFGKPSQATISWGQYPLVRGLYYILKENAAGLGTGFINFMSHERGQLIFRRSYLAPGKMSFNKRSTKIKEQNN